MTVCPIAVVAGCRKCPAYSICPLKTVLGDAAKSGKDGADAKPVQPPDAGRRQKK